MPCCNTPSYIDNFGCKKMATHVARGISRALASNRALACRYSWRSPELNCMTPRQTADAIALQLTRTHLAMQQLNTQIALCAHSRGSSMITATIEAILQHLATAFHNSEPPAVAPDSTCRRPHTDGIPSDLMGIQHVIFLYSL